ncbi:hypothetical protein [Streptomyces sp. HUAS ZL42]
MNIVVLVKQVPDTGAERTLSTDDAVHWAPISRSGPSAVAAW